MTKIRFYNTFDIAVPIMHKLIPFLTEHSDVDARFVISSSEYREVDISKRKTYIDLLVTPRFFRSKASIHFFYLLLAVKDIVRSKSSLNVFFTQPPFGLPLLCFASILSRKDYIVHVMDYHPDFLIASQSGVIRRGLHSAIDRLYISVLNRAKHVVVIGDCMRQLLYDKGLEDKSISVIRNVSWSEAKEKNKPTGRADLLKISEQQIEIGDRAVVLYSGNQGVAHEFGTVLGVAERLSESHIFIFVGKGRRSSEIESCSEKLSNVFALGYLEESEFAEVKARADIHFISLRENYTGLMVPSKLYSSLQAGKVVLFEGSAEGEVSQCLTQNGCGYTVPHGDTQKMIDVLRDLHTNVGGDAFVAMGDEARVLYDSKYSSKKFCEHYFQVFKQVLGEDIDHANLGVASGE